MCTVRAQAGEEFEGTSRHEYALYKSQGIKIATSLLTLQALHGRGGQRFKNEITCLVQLQHHRHGQCLRACLHLHQEQLYITRQEACCVPVAGQWSLGLLAAVCLLSGGTLET